MIDEYNWTEIIKEANEGDKKQKEALIEMSEKVTLAWNQLVEQFENLASQLSKAFKSLQPVIDILEEQETQKPKPKKFREVKHIRDRSYERHLRPLRHNRTTYK